MGLKNELGVARNEAEIVKVHNKKGNLGKLKDFFC